MKFVLSPRLPITHNGRSGPAIVGLPTGASGFPFARDRWHQVAVTKRPGEARVYLDGARIISRVTPDIGDQVTEYTEWKTFDGLTLPVAFTVKRAGQKSGGSIRPSIRRSSRSRTSSLFLELPSPAAPTPR